MKIKARSGVIIWITALALFVCTVVTAVMYSQFSGIGSYLMVLIIMVVSTAMTFSFILRNYLLVTEKAITVCFGMTTTVIKMESVRSLKKVRNLIASASASTKRIEIQYDEGTIYISPKDEESFIQTVCSYNPKIKIY